MGGGGGGSRTNNPHVTTGRRQGGGNPGCACDKRVLGRGVSLLVRQPFTFIDFRKKSVNGLQLHVVQFASL